MTLVTTDRTYLTVEEVADELRVHQETVRRWIRNGDLGAVQLGKKSGWRIHRGELRRFILDRSGAAER